MTPTARLSEHAVFRELPFCGVLLDTRTFRVYKLSQRAAAALRTATCGPSEGNPYGHVLGSAEGVADPELAAHLVARFAALGLVRET
ncbi:MAG: hypothetical protein GEV03_20435 [Streptosporangiales bacterium]|nr:hypothetical protein [Streptosporangiales bacterium]